MRPLPLFCKTIMDIELPKSKQTTLLFCATVLAATAFAHAQQPVMYEVQINGETFRVEGNRQAVVSSTSNPKIKYQLAVRVDPVQILRLNKVQLEYENPVTIDDDKGTDVRCAHVNHKDGYTLSVIDPGQKFEKKQQSDALDVLTKSTTERLTAKKFTNIVDGKPLNAKFGDTSGPWRMIHFKDEAGKPGTCMLFVLTGESFTVSCVGEFLDEQANDAKPWIGNAVKSLSATK